MHILLLLLALGMALILRWGAGSWRGKLNWQWTITLFALPPLILLTTCLAIVLMGCGEMFGHRASMGSHLSAAIFLAWSFWWGIYSLWSAWHTHRTVRQYPIHTVQGRSLRLLESAHPYSAQVGAWEPQLCASKGLLNLLSPPQLEAVFAHEQAHLFYRDTLIFFGLGWLKRMSAWLPQTQALWEELLWFRECRADRKATETCDPLVLAEALALVAQASATHSPDVFTWQAAFAAHHPRLLFRVEHLLRIPQTPLTPSSLNYWVSFSQLAIALMPLVFIPWHIR